MDAARFDRWTRSLGVASRRAALRGLVGGALAAARGAAGAGAQTGTCRGTGQRCGGGRAPCCSGVCKGRPGEKTCRCPQVNCCQCESGGVRSSCNRGRGLDLAECQALCAAEGGAASFVAEANPGVTTACRSNNRCVHVFCEPQTP